MESVNDLLSAGGYSGKDNQLPSNVAKIDVPNTFTQNQTFTKNISMGTSASSSSNNLRKITTSTSAPSGGSDGDIWFQYS